MYIVLYSLHKTLFRESVCDECEVMSDIQFVYCMLCFSFSRGACSSRPKNEIVKRTVTGDFCKNISNLVSILQRYLYLEQNSAVSLLISVSFLTVFLMYFKEIVLRIFSTLFFMTLFQIDPSFMG